MGRAIKFRAWFKGNPYRDDQPPQMVYDVHKKHADHCPFMYRTFGGMIEDSVSYEIMQYTGLKDRNGKEIYEGDIVKAYRLGIEFDPEDYTISVVKQHKFGWLPFVDVLGGTRHDYFGNLYQVEIIGNIYSNPELLEAN